MQNQTLATIIGSNETITGLDLTGEMFTSPLGWENSREQDADGGGVALDRAKVFIVSPDGELVTRLASGLTCKNVVIDKCSGVRSLLNGAPLFGPGCVVVDLDVAGLDGPTLYRRLKARGWQVPFVVLVQEMEIRSVVQMMRLGVQDIVAKSATPEEFAAAMELALQRSRKECRRSARNYELRRRWAQLTPRECEIVRFVLIGLLNKQIAERLNLALVTVKLHRANVMRKLGARSAAELAQLALAVNYGGRAAPSRRVIPERAPLPVPILATGAQ